MYTYPYGYTHTLSHTPTHSYTESRITASVHGLEGLLPLRGLGCLVVVVEAARGGNVLAPSLVRRAAASFTFTTGVGGTTIVLLKVV